MYSAGDVCDDDNSEKSGRGIEVPRCCRVQRLGEGGPGAKRTHSSRVSVAPDENRVALAHHELAAAVREARAAQVLARLAGNCDGAGTGRIGDGDGADGVVELLRASVGGMSDHGRTLPSRS